MHNQTSNIPRQHSDKAVWHTATADCSTPAPAKTTFHTFGRKLCNSFVGRKLRNSLVYALVAKLPPALCQEFRQILKFIRQDIAKLHNPGADVLLASLRTATHILDKSLQSLPWKRGRGLEAYERVKRLLLQLDESSDVTSEPSYQWALSKIREYEMAQRNGRDTSDAIPLPIASDIRDTFVRLIQSRRSVRSFLRKPIDPVVLREIAGAVHWAPCSCCRQPIVLHVTQTEDLVRDCLRQCAGATGFGDYVPCFISVCADTRFYSLIDRHLPIIDASLGMQSFLLVAHAYGLAGTILNWMHATRKEELRLRSYLAIPPHQEIVFNVALGFPSTTPLAPAYKSLSQTWVFHEELRQCDFHEQTFRNENGHPTIGVCPSSAMTKEH